MVYTLRFFSLKKAVCFTILPYMVPVLFTVYIQCVLKLKKNSGTKSLINSHVYQGLTLRKSACITQDVFTSQVVFTTSSDYRSTRN